MLKKIITLGWFFLGILGLNTPSKSVNPNIVVEAYQQNTNDSPNPLFRTLNTARTSYEKLSIKPENLNGSPIEDSLQKEIEPPKEQSFLFFYTLFTNPDQFCTTCTNLPPEMMKALLTLIFPENRLMNWQETLAFFIRGFPDYIPLTIISLLKSSETDIWDALMNIEISPKITTNIAINIFNLDPLKLSNNQKKLLQFCIKHIMENFSLSFDSFCDLESLAQPFTKFILNMKPQDNDSFYRENTVQWRQFATWLANNIDKKDTLIHSQLLESITILLNPAFLQKEQMPDENFWLCLYMLDRDVFDHILKMHISDQEERLLQTEIIKMKVYLKLQYDDDEYKINNIKKQLEIQKKKLEIYRDKAETERQRIYITKPLVALRDIFSQWRSAPEELKKKYRDLSKAASSSNTNMTLLINALADLLKRTQEEASLYTTETLGVILPELFEQWEDAPNEFKEQYKQLLEDHLEKKDVLSSLSNLLYTVKTLMKAHDLVKQWAGQPKKQLQNLLNDAADQKYNLSSIDKLAVFFKQTEDMQKVIQQLNDFFEQWKDAPKELKEEHIRLLEEKYDSSSIGKFTNFLKRVKEMSYITDLLVTLDNTFKQWGKATNALKEEYQKLSKEALDPNCNTISLINDLTKLLKRVKMIQNISDKLRDNVRKNN